MGHRFIYDIFLKLYFHLILDLRWIPFEIYVPTVRMVLQQTEIRLLSLEKIPWLPALIFFARSGNKWVMQNKVRETGQRTQFINLVLPEVTDQVTKENPAQVSLSLEGETMLMLFQSYSYIARYIWCTSSRELLSSSPAKAACHLLLISNIPWDISTLAGGVHCSTKVNSTEREQVGVCMCWFFSV